MATPKSSNPYIVRHFGLTLLSHAIHYNFLNYNEPRKQAVRNWVIDLATSISRDDPHFIREKISFLWVAVAKRVWGLESPGKEADAGGDDDSNGVQDQVSDGWQNMDSLLVEMWSKQAATRELSLSIFRTLFEDLYMLDDPIASKRASVLSAQCIEIVTSEENLKVTYESRVDSLQRLREGSEGWLNRWSQALGQCLASGLPDDESENLAVKILETLKTCLYWVFPMAIRNANLLEILSTALTLDANTGSSERAEKIIKMKILSTDCLHVLFTRSFSNDEDFQAIVGAVFLPSGIQTLSQVYSSLHVSPDDIDDKAYVLLKKLVEMIIGLGEYLNAKTNLPENADLGGYLALVLRTTMHPSLVVSGFSLQFWCSVLRIDNLIGKQKVLELLPNLLDVASKRCLRYEDVEEEHESRKFLDLDFDSTPEIHVFLGNYRRFIEDIVRLVVCLMPLDAIGWLKARMEEFFSSELGWQSLNSTKLDYQGNPAYYYAYSQFMVVESALRGVSRWTVWYTAPDKEEIGRNLTLVVEDWGQKIIGMNLKDPDLLRKMVQCLVQFAPVLKDSKLMFAVLERVLTTCTTEYPEEFNQNDETRELLKQLRSGCGTELNRLAYMIPESLMQIYDDLERVIGEIINSGKLSDHEIVSFKSFLLVVSQRSNVSNKQERFANIVDPVLSSWSDEATMKGLTELQWFMERVGIVKIAEYFRSRGVTANTDLLKTDMDDTGRQLKTELNQQWSQLFPIRATRIFIQYTIEKLDHSSQEYKDLLQLWKPRIQPILPHILQLIAQIQSYHNPENWRDLPAEVQSFVRYSCQERFWQVGISTKTKDEFLDESVKAMHTLRDFADSVGHVIRYTREYSFLTLGSITQLEETMYEIPGMAENLWNALARDSAGVTSHSWRHMISLVLRNVVKNCPIHLVKPFMTEFLPSVLQKLDEVLLERWNRVYQKGIQLEGGEDDESLSEEMMEEHLLRQLTAVVDRFLIDLVGQLGNKQQGTTTEAKQQQSAELRETVLGTREILGPFLTICTHIITFKDVRCSFNCCLILRNILPHILLKDNEVDCFLCDNLTKTCLQILNDPYFADVHNEAGYILTTLYTILRSKTQRPLETLSQLLPNVTSQEFEDFENRLSNPKSLRQQRGVFLEFLSLVQAMHTQDSNGDAREVQRKKAEKKNEKNKWLTKKSNQGGNLMEEEGLEKSAIANLFGDS